MGAGGSQTPAATAAMADIAANVAEESRVPVALLGGYLRALVAVAGTGRRLARRELDAGRDRRHSQTKLAERLAGGVGGVLAVDNHLRSELDDTPPGTAAAGRRQAR